MAVVLFLFFIFQTNFDRELRRWFGSVNSILAVEGDGSGLATKHVEGEEGRK